MERISQPALAGILMALVGFTSSSAVVLTGLRAVGATPSEAASGLLAVCATQGLGILWLVRRHRIPLTLAWSTPGAAPAIPSPARPSSRISPHFLHQVQHYMWSKPL